MRKWIRPWPWGLASLGLLLILHYVYPLGFLHSTPEEDPPREGATVRPEMRDEEEAILALARGERFQEALDRAEAALGRTDLSDGESAALLLLKGRLLISLKRPDESIFRKVSEGRGPARLRVTACEHWGALRFGKGDYAGAIEVYQKILAGDVDDRARGSSIMEVEANSRHLAAAAISECYEKMGLGKEAFRWALRAKRDWPFESFCGNAVKNMAEEAEDRLERTARLAGISYAREKITWEALNRRQYGPPEIECVAGIAAGGVLLAVAAWAFWRRRARFAPEGERLRAAGWVTGISALAFLMALFPGSQGRPWVEACLWAGLLGLPLPLFCWYRALELPLLRRALRDSNCSSH